VAAQELNLHGLAASDYPLSLLVCLLVTFGLRCSCEIDHKRSTRLYTSMIKFMTISDNC